MAPPTGVNGVLPVSVLQKNSPPSAPRGPKASQPRLKLLLRRLPPGLTKIEFETMLGDEWKMGAGKVDWLEYKRGKVSKDAAKPSRPSRAYIHVISQAHVSPLGDHVRELTFHDAAKSYQDGALVGPPALEFAPYHRMPGGRRRNDTRQGTIDQDQEFKDFLESLTNPITKPPAADDDGKKERAKTTPLIEALREKKANKDKPRAASKHGRGETKEDAEKKILGKSGKEAAAAAGDKSRRPSKAEKAAREAVKVLNKEASSKDGPSTPSTTSTTAASSPAPERKRGNAAIAKSMLQRDLGIGPAANRRRGTKREITPSVQEPGARTEEIPAGKQKAKETPPMAAAAAAEKTSLLSPKKERPSRAERRAFKATLADKTNNKHAGEDSKIQEQPKASLTPAPTILKKPQTTHTPTPSRGPATSRGPPTEPAAARVTPSQQAAPASAPRPAASTPTRTSPPAPAPTGRQAFLKHANASQGITEPLIEEALKIFGAIEKVEIDKRKGFAYVDFADSEGLAKALAGSPVKVAQGAVQVLERKEKVARVVRPPPGPHPGPHPGHHGPPTGPARGRGGFPIRGRGRGGARGGHAAPNTSNPASPAMTTVAPAAAPAPALAPPAVAVGGDAAT